MRYDGEPIPPNVPAKAVSPLNLASAKRSEEFSLADTRILLSDFGEAHAPEAETRLGKDCHMPIGTQPPEARFAADAPLSHAANIWGLGTTIWEILGMKAIFSREFTTEDDVTSQQLDVLGPMPTSCWESWEERRKFFDGEIRRGEAWPPLDEAFEEFIQKYRRKRPSVGVFGEEETAAILNLMRRMLAVRPEERPTADEVLRSEWMTKWVLHDVDRSRGRVL